MFIIREQSSLLNNCKVKMYIDDMHFYSYKKAKLICVTVLSPLFNDYDDSGECWRVNHSEYYEPEDIETACKAFDERNKKLTNNNMQASQYAKSLDDILEKDYSKTALKNDYLLQALPENIAQYVLESGSLALAYNGLTEIENAEIATRAIQHLNKKNLDLMFFFYKDISKDSSYESITYEFDDSRFTTIVALIKRLKYKEFYDNNNKPLLKRSDKIIYGPVVRREHAQTIIDFINKLYTRES